VSPIVVKRTPTVTTRKRPRDPVLADLYAQEEFLSSHRITRRMAEVFAFQIGQGPSGRRQGPAEGRRQGPAEGRRQGPSEGRRGKRSERLHSHS
jgi:hypothetical protein